MKNHWILCTALGAGFLAPSTLPIQDDREDLEATVLHLQDEISELRTIVEDSERVTRETVAYLQSLSKSSKAMTSTLDSVEQKGFTAGINPSSRETLLSGWRAQLEKLQKNVPSLKKSDADEAGSRRRRR